MSKRYATTAWVMPTYDVAPLWEEIVQTAIRYFERMLQTGGVPPERAPRWQAAPLEAAGPPEYLDPGGFPAMQLRLEGVAGEMELAGESLYSELPLEDRRARLLHRLDNARYRMARLHNWADRIARFNHVWWLGVEGSSHQVFRVAMGALAASIADHTGGLIHSEAGFWEYERFPATAADFLEWFFQPEHCAYSGWAERTRRHWQRIHHCLGVED
jgi:hypothetical protein